MGLPIFLCIAIISVAAAKQGPGYIHCRCSPSGISTNSSDAYKFIEDSLSRLNEISGKIQPGIIGTDAGVEAARSIMKDCISKFKETPCIDADAALRSVHGKIPICYYNVESGKNIDGIGRILNNCDGNVVFNALKAKNEGCVAIEHLAGLKLQHLRNLKRPVLCHVFSTTVKSRLTKKLLSRRLIFGIQRRQFGLFTFYKNCQFLESVSESVYCLRFLKESFN